MTSNWPRQSRLGVSYISKAIELYHPGTGKAIRLCQETEEPRVLRLWKDYADALDLKMLALDKNGKALEVHGDFAGLNNGKT
ncbi:hypothetical protein ACFL1X_03150 [Candidatus Hydrogenedentota bacterium]